MMNTIVKKSSAVCVVAIVGGSGSGKTWLANRLRSNLGRKASNLSLDDFYRDLSPLAPEHRAQINFDSPSAIDWPVLTQVLTQFQEGAEALKIPRYDFTTHCRFEKSSVWRCKPIVVVDGLWLLHRPELRSLFDLKVFIDCPADLRFWRRMQRDVMSRGRTPSAVISQFASTVLPMHEIHVQPQTQWADHLIQSPVTEQDALRLAAIVKARIKSKEVACKISSCARNN